MLHILLCSTLSPAMEEMLLQVDDIEAATAEVKSAGGRVTIQLGHDLLIAQVPGDVSATLNSFASASSHIADSASSATLSNTEAYWKFRGDKLKPQPKVQHWTEKTAPKCFPQPSAHLVYDANSPYRQTLTGKIVVLVVVASGPGRLAISDLEFTKIKSEVLAGLNFWTNQAPASAGLSFVMYSGLADITASDSTSCYSSAACHNVFADPAIQYFGYNIGQAGKDSIARDYKHKAGADGAYIVFFSKYKQHHFAYAYLRGGPIYMQYSNDGWGPDQIDRVFAHETGHVFNAPDEYANCNCYTNYGKGTCTARNDNCVRCTSFQSSCIMDTNDLNNICANSRKHVGWC